MRAIQQAVSAGHFQKRPRRIKPLVAGFCAGAVQSLLQRIGGQNAHDDRNIGLQGNLRDTFDGFGAHVIEVGGVAAHHGAQADNAVVFAGKRRLARHRRNFKGSRRAHHRDAIGIHAGPGKRIHRAFQQALGDQAVEAGNNHANPVILAK